MKYLNWHSFILALLVALVGFCMIGGCDSGEKVIDEVTGNQAAKQYHKSKNDIENIADQQVEKYSGIPGDDEREGDE